uniref:Uncharacterized protein n=1 Tax=Cacopsylla melanoneura TaxID=428564 RepID=A0A8D8VJ64_9HEMI
MFLSCFYHNVSICLQSQIYLLCNLSISTFPTFFHFHHFINVSQFTPITVHFSLYLFLSSSFLFIKLSHNLRQFVSSFTLFLVQIRCLIQVAALEEPVHHLVLLHTPLNVRFRQ